MVNLMAYDFFGAFDGITGINAPLYASSKATGIRAVFNVVSLIVQHQKRGWRTIKVFHLLGDSAARIILVGHLPIFKLTK
jgi:GH18 family chitinase